MSKTVLLADDSVTIQKVVGITFANEDIELVTVDNGDDALSRAREIKPDLVLADANMPGLSGYELAAAIKGDPDLARTPVLLLTGTFENYDEQRASECGVDSQIAKPFEAQALVDEVHRLIEQGPAAVLEPQVEEPQAAQMEEAPALEAQPELEAPEESEGGFDFADLDFDAGSGGPEQTQILDATDPPAATTATEPAAEIAPFELADEDTQPEAAESIDDALFSETSFLDPLQDETGDITAPTEAEELFPEEEPVWLDRPSEEPAEDTAHGRSGQSEILGGALVPEPAAGPVPSTASGLAPEALHEALEKIAWEAFGPMSEQLVREVVQKVETIAWEIIPQLAERLIREEIERMKKHNPES